MSPRPRNLKPLLLLACLGALLASAPARALKTDKNQPINVHSDHGDFQADPKNSSNGVGVYTGHVVITQGSIVINADKAVFHVVDNNLDTADITGNPATFVQQPDQGLPMHGQSLEITYDVPKNEIVLITHARLTQQVLKVGSSSTSTAAPAARTVIDGIVVNDISVPGERLMTAERIRYNTDTQHVIAKSGDSSEQRVHVSFPPKVPASTTAAQLKQAVPPAAKNHAAPTMLMPRQGTPSAAAAAATAQAPTSTSHAGPP